MAQKRFFTYKQNDATFDLITSEVGVLPSGVYFGYDFSPTADMNLILTHSITGLSYLNSDGVTLLSDLGICRTNQGVVVREDSTLAPLPINTTSTEGRIDAIVLSHSYLLNTGGQQALYSVIQGTPSATPVKPSLTDPNKQVVVGWLTLPPNTTLLTDSGVEFERNDQSIYNKSNLDVSSFATQAELDLKANQADLDALEVIVDGKADGGLNYAFTDAANEYTSQQRHNKGVDINTSVLTDITSDGNYFRASDGIIDGMTDIRNGTEIEIRAVGISGITLRHNQSIGTSGYIKVFSPTGRNVTLQPNDTVKFRQDSGEWLITQLPSSSLVPIASILMWSGSVGTIPNGWELCDGGTTNGITKPDLRGRFVLGVDPSGTFNTVGATGGEVDHTITLNEMPQHNHTGGSGAGAVDSGNFGLIQQASPTDTDTVAAINVDPTGTEPRLTVSPNDIPLQGNGDAHNNMPPYYVLAYIIKVG